jgi:hypothetical protein
MQHQTVAKTAKNLPPLLVVSDHLPSFTPHAPTKNGHIGHFAHRTILCSATAEGCNRGENGENSTDKYGYSQSHHPIRPANIGHIGQ